MASASIQMGTTTSPGPSATAAIGASDSGQQEELDGVLDKVRISSLPRSDAWIAAQSEAVRGALVIVGTRESW